MTELRLSSDGCFGSSRQVGVRNLVAAFCPPQIQGICSLQKMSSLNQLENVWKKSELDMESDLFGRTSLWIACSMRLLRSYM
jgi:hypothetical protein